MPVGLQTNFRDPRFQEALLAERASRPFHALPTSGRATREFVGQDLDTRLAFQRIGLQSKMGNARLKQQKFMLGLEKDKLKDRKQMLPWQIGIGGLTSGIAMWEGHRRSKMLAQENALRGQQHNDMMAGLREIAIQRRI